MYSMEWKWYEITFKSLIVHHCIFIVFKNGINVQTITSIIYWINGSYQANNIYEKICFDWMEIHDD